MEINVTNRYTEISTGGGKYLTQSSKTMFPAFWTRKILAAGETPDDFREVTQAQREAMEAARAAWVRPSQAFIDHFTYLANRYVADYGGFNEATGYFELGTVKNLTTQDAMKIILSPQGISGSIITESGVENQMPYSEVRALFPIKLSAGTFGQSNFNLRYYDCEQLEEAVFLQNNGTFCNRSFYDAFGYCFKLRVLTFGWGGLPNSRVTCSLTTAFVQCKALEDFTPPRYWADMYLGDSPKLSAESLDCIIRRADPQGDTKGITVTLHATAYARLTEEQLAAAAAKNITFTTP